MKGLTTPESDALTYMAWNSESCDGAHSSAPEPAPFTYETYVALKARGLLSEYTCAAGCVHVEITALGREAKRIADIVASGGPTCPT